VITKELGSLPVYQTKDMDFIACMPKKIVEVGLGMLLDGRNL
jgi:hypothetical protein